MKSISIAWIASLMLVCSTSGISYAQLENLRFENLSGRRGLPKIGINTILQDKEGFMWFGTNEGLYRFDGHSATVFTKDPNDPEHSLPSNLIIATHEDRHGRLWVATPVGLIQADKRTGKVLMHTANATPGVKAILEDQQGILWLGTSGGIARFDPLTRQFTLFPSPNGLFVGHLQQDPSGTFWAATFEGIYLFNPHTEKYSFFSSIIPSAFLIDTAGIAWVGTFGAGLFRLDTRKPGNFETYNPDGAVSKIIVGIFEADGYLWLTGGGLQRLDPRTNEVIDYPSDNSMPGRLSSTVVANVYQDKLGHLWVGTAEGISKALIHSGPFNSYQITRQPDAILRSENRINNILVDSRGTIWVSSNKKGVCFYDIATQQMTPVSVNPNDSRNTIENQQWPLLEDKQGRIWVGTDLDKGLYVLDRSTGKFTRHDSEISIRCMALSPSGTIWVGSDVKGIAAFNPATKTFSYYPPTENNNGMPRGTYVSSLLATRAGDVWIASLGKGLFRLNPNTGKILQYLPKPGDTRQGINDRVVIALYESDKGIIWIGTAEGGLNRFDPRTNLFTHVTTREGLPSNWVTSINGDEHGNLWLGTSQGLSLFNPITNMCRNFDDSDGLPDNFFVESSGYMYSGKMFLGTQNGLVIFHPDSIKEEMSMAPVYITTFKVREQSRPLSSGEIELSYQENFFSFDFTCINYDSPEKTQYAYQLEGIDKDWVTSGNRRFANFTDLSPGSYTFRVKASIDNHKWNVSKSPIRITIHPPWWLTWWAYAMYGVLGISVLLGLLNYTASRERLKSDLKLQRLEAQKMHEIDHLKSRFFANISHEFRTPVTLILGPLENFLSRTSPESDERPVYQMMQRNAQRLLQLINQLLDLSKLEAGSMKLEIRPTPITSFLNTIVLSFSSLAGRRNIQYSFQYPKGNHVVYFDADKLEKIITNLLSNAFKFTPDGGAIAVSAQLLPTKMQRLVSTVSKKDTQLAEEHMLELMVKDNGIGIPKDRLDKIFDRYYQTDTLHARELEGSGIGLSLLRELVELHAGEVMVESEQGEGACFVVRLPLAVADFDELAIVGPSLDNGEQSTAQFPGGAYASGKLSDSKTEDAPMILIVEDNADIRHFIRENLHHIYRVIEAVDGEKGYSLAVENIPDLILSDIMMPKMDGIELCHKLKDDRRTDHIPVILLTAKASGENKMEGLETGADDYIIKPFKSAELLVRIKNLIEIRKKLRERFSSEITLQPGHNAIPSKDEKLLKHVTRITEEHMADVAFGVEAFCREAGMSHTQLHRKLKALTDQSPGDFIRIMRLKRASDLLNSHAGNIAEVAYMVGFNDPSYFTKCFQKQFGKTPSQFIETNAH